VGDWIEYGEGNARVGRVAWTRDREDGRHWMGVELLTDAASPAPAGPMS